MPAIRVAVGVVLLAWALPMQADQWAVLGERWQGEPPAEMMPRWLMAKVNQADQRWRARYEERTELEAIREYQRRMRETFLGQIGGLPQRTPLGAQVTERIEREGFVVEKILFESQPRHYVTAALFLPDEARFQPPYPGVLVPCGHSAGGKASEVYQRACILLAQHGMAALIYDPVDQGERQQMLEMPGGEPYRANTTGHTMMGIGSLLLGRNTARFRIWDGIRALDYLQSRPEIDSRRIGCTGNSGGGTLTAYLMALDDRIVAAAPSCYITTIPHNLRNIGPQDAEQNIYAQLALGLDHADYLMMRAPRPTLICCATDDYFDIDGAWRSFRHAKRLYTRMGHPQRVDLAETDNTHGFDQTLRQAAASWMSRWLLDRDEPVVEDESVQTLTEEEIQVTSEGQVMRLDGAVSVYDLNRQEEARLAGERRRHWRGDRAELPLEEVRQLAGIRHLKDLPEPRVSGEGKLAERGMHVEKLLIEPEPGIALPALKIRPEAPAAESSDDRVVLYVHAQGKAAELSEGGEIERLVSQGATVLAVDLRGTGETAPEHRTKWAGTAGDDWADTFTAYLLGLSYVGLRAEDLLVCARLASSDVEDGGKVELVAVGQLGVPALHAAALHPELFAEITLRRSLTSWADLVELGASHDQLAGAVHGALGVYDLPDLARLLGDRLTITEPVDALGRPLR